MSKPRSVILFDDDQYKSLWPLNFTKPVAKLRLSYFTIEEQWTLISKLPISCLTVDYLSKKYSPDFTGDDIYINAAILPSKLLWQSIQNLQTEEALYNNNRLVACRPKTANQMLADLLNASYQKREYTNKIHRLNKPKAIFKLAEQSIQLDKSLINTTDFQQDPSQNYNTIFNPQDCHIHSTATIKGVSINAEKGPVIIGKDALVMEGAMLRGPLVIGDNAVVKMGSKIYGSTTIGSYCKAGGEINNVVFQAYSNKGHDGYLGNSVIGEWCNLGADSNCSNLKNNYNLIKTWSYQAEDYINSEEQFHGLIMGDHTKCSINTMFNTGTVTGVFASIFSSSFPPKFIPSFTWGINQTYQFEKAIETAKRVMQRKNINLQQNDIDILAHIFKITTSFRNNII